MIRAAAAVRNKTRKQLLEELAATQSRLTELQTVRETENRVERTPHPEETHFAHLFRDARIANLLFDTRGHLLSANTGGGLLTAAEYETAVRESLFESAIWTPEIRSRLANGEILRLRITVEVGNHKPAAAARPTTLHTGVAHLEAIISSLGEQGYLVQVQDVTQEVESKAALREREVFFRSVFQAIPAPIVVWRHASDGRLILHFYNSAARAITAGGLAELEGLSVDEVYAHEPEFAARVQRSFRTGESLSSEQEYSFRTTGEKRYIRITSAKVGPEYVVESVADLTELKQTQEALAENEVRFRRLLDNAPDIVYRLALKPSMRFEYISPAATAVTGFTPEELMADLQFAGTRVHPEDRQDPPPSMDAIPAAGGPQLLRWIRKDGQVIWLEHRFVVVYEGSAPVALEGIAREVTAEVEARQVLERLLDEKQLLLQEVHHRVKNNLGILHSLIELQAATLPEARLRDVLRATQGRILSVARVHEALYRTDADTPYVDLADYVNRLGAELREAYVGQGVEIEYNLVHYALSQQNAIHFGLLVNELISNTLKHAFPVERTAPARVEVCLTETNDSLCLTVQDNGVGLPADFNPQTSDSLGLQVIEMLVDQMEGRVEYLSGAGSGAEVRVIIPRAQLS